MLRESIISVMPYNDHSSPHPISPTLLREVEGG